VTRATAARRAKPSLGRRDWVAAGQRLLIEGGLPAVKLAALTRSLGVTSGSFYHHFTDFRDYLDALADDYGEGNIDRVFDALAPIEDPAERLRTMFALREQWDVGRLDSAMRVWASSDERARAAVARLDERMIEVVRAAFVALGYSRQQARVRAVLGFAAGVGQPFLFGRPPSGKDALAALDILIGTTT
jgi:AcrR family transcriptional regulator